MTKIEKQTAQELVVRLRRLNIDPKNLCKFLSNRKKISISNLPSKEYRSKLDALTAASLLEIYICIGSNL